MTATNNGASIWEMFHMLTEHETVDVYMDGKKVGIARLETPDSIYVEVDSADYEVITCAEDIGCYIDENLDFSK